MGGWLEKWGLKLISTQVVVEVEVGVELGNTGCIKKMSRFVFFISRHLLELQEGFYMGRKKRSCCLF